MAVAGSVRAPKLQTVRVFSAVIMPASVNAASTVSTWSRPCIVSWKSSMRVEIQRIGTPSSIASNATVSSSG